jgi:hypothetical protein
MSLSDMLYFAADTVPVWRPFAIVVLVGIVIGCIVFYLEVTD